VNKDLYGKQITLTEKMKNYLETCFNKAKGASERTEGYKRNQTLRNSDSVSYSQLKRIKNWFDNYNGNPNTNEYILNGGDYMKNWVNQILQSERNSLYNGKKTKSDAGMSNQFIMPHEKNNLNTINRPSQSHKNPTEKHDTAIAESLKRINELIKKII
jgi:hypothetical protein